MGFFRRSTVDKPPSDGPEEWHRKALERDAEIMREREAERQRALESVGETAVGSHHNPGHQEHTNHSLEHQEDGMREIDELSEEYLRFLDGIRADDGKFIRIGDTIFISPGERRGFAGHGLIHQRMLERASRKVNGNLSEISEQVIGPEDSGLVDAGKWDLYLDDEPSEDGKMGRFRIFGRSGDYGSADQDGRARTVELASQILGENFITKEDPHKF
jgi:hypothetical protein